MTHYITTTSELSISEGKVDEFKKLATEMIKKVQANEPNTLRYDWFLCEDENKCYVIEMYKDSEAVQTHWGNINDLLGPLLELSSLTELTIYGNPSDEVRQVYESVGGKIFKYWNGLTP